MQTKFASSDYKRLFSLLEAIYAEAVAYEGGKLTKERCCGCEYDHPSQRQHDCIMLSEQERWQSYGLEAIERVIVKRMVWREFVEVTVCNSKGEERTQQRSIVLLLSE